LHYYYYYFIYQCIWVLQNVADLQWTQLAPSRNWIKCVKCRTYLSVTNSIFFSADIVLWKFVEVCDVLWYSLHYIMCCGIACTV
jgi:hypothetical protein